MTCFLLLLATASAGDLYVNGHRVSPLSLASINFEKVDVSFKANGDIWIDAPQYELKFEGQPPPPAPTPTPAPVAYSAPTPANPPAVPMGDQSAPRAQAYTPGTAAPGASSATAPLQAGTAPPGQLGAVAAARWWLVTEDNGSSGHTVDISINGHPAQTIRSGEAQRIIDVRGFLRPGANSVRLQSQSVGATGGTLFVYLGSGTNESGSLSLDEPQVQFGVGSGQTGSQVRDYTLTVP